MGIKINASELLMATKATRKKDGTKEVLSGIKVTCKDGEYIVVATDAYRLVEFTGLYDAEENKDRIDTIIDADIIKKNVKSSDSFVEITQNDDDITMIVFDKNGNQKCEVSTKAVEGKYPGYEKLFNVNNYGDQCNIVSLNVSFLGDMCDIVKKAYKKDCPITIEFTGEYKPVLFAAKMYDAVNRSVSRSFRGLVMPVRL